MTNEQHIENLKKLKSFYNGSYGASVNAAINALKHEQALGEAFNIALLYGKEKGMEAIDKALYQMGMDGIKEQEIEALEQEPCDDAISRQAVFDYIYNDLGLGDEENGKDVERQMELESSYRYIKSLPSVNPQPKTGHWIYKMLKGQFCSICDEQSMWKFNYCPNCGAKMVEPQEGSEKRGAGMINTKETIEETLTEYGVPFTDALADRLIKEIYYECDQYLSEFKDKFIRILKTTDSGDYLDDMDYVSIDDVKKAFQLADIELSKESKTFKG